MNLDRIRERLANGSRPFALELSSGKRLPVPHLEFLALGKGGGGVVAADDSVTTVDALHIVAIADLQTRRRRK